VLSWTVEMDDNGVKLWSWLMRIKKIDWFLLNTLNG